MFAILITTVGSVNNTIYPLLESTKNGLIMGILSTYDKTQRAQIDEQLTVTVNFFIQGLSSVNEVNMDYEFTAFFRQVWYISWPF